MPPHPRDGRTLLGHLWGGHTNTTTTTFGVADTVFDCGSGVVRWCTRHPQHLGSPWGIGGNAFTSPGWQGTPWPPCLTDPTHPTMAALTPLYSNCGSGVLWWGAHHQVHLGATLRLKALPPHLGEDRALHRSPWCTTSLAVGDVHIIIVRRPEPQFEPSNTVLGAPNVVVVVCVCPPKGDQALSCHPWGVGGIAPNAPWRP